NGSKLFCRCSPVRLAGAFLYPARYFVPGAPAERASGLANGSAGHRRKRVNESGVGQTAAVFDVMLKMPTSRQGSGGLSPTLKAGASLGSQGVRRGPACEVAPSAAGFFSFPPPALSERRHRSFARRLITLKVTQELLPPKRNGW